jgi:hypothetical protein
VLETKGGIMGALVQPKLAPAPTETRPQLRAVPARPRTDLHLYTYLVSNALAWALWAAISVSAEAWYWWVIVPLTGWTLVLALHLGHTLGWPRR